MDGSTGGTSVPPLLWIGLATSVSSCRCTYDDIAPSKIVCVIVPRTSPAGLFGLFPREFFFADPARFAVGAH
jgi:hypothetical protein